MNTSADGEVTTIARNVSTRYLAIAVEMGVGLVLLPFNVSHLGKATYGLWILTSSITAYFSVLDLGYSGALVKFVAQYRARSDMRALNEILSTLFYLFASFGVVTYVVATVVAINLGHLFHITPAELMNGRIVLLVTSLNVAVGMPFSVFGAIINGFQRYDLNNLAGTASSIVVAIVNVVVLLLGYGLVPLVLATGLVRLLTYLVYRANAYHVFPELRLPLRLFSRERLREVTGFSVYMLLIDWAYKLNYSVDALVIGAFLNTSAVAVWSVGQRLAEGIQRFTNQLNEILFPNVVDHDASHRQDRLQSLFLIATRLSLATVIPLGGTLMLMAVPLVRAWVGPQFEGSALIVQLLSFIVIVRVGNAMGSTLLKGAGRHSLVAYCNVATAVANLALSVTLVRPLGLPGVAIGTLLPVTLSAVFIIFPASCQRVGITIWRALREAVWPAVWPAAVMVAYVALTRPLIAPSLVAIAAESVAAVVFYAATFLMFSVSAAERRFFVARAVAVVSRTGVLTPSATEGV